MESYLDKYDEEHDDIVPEDFTPKRALRCYCGQVRIETSQVGNPPACMGCDYCHSTLADTKHKCSQRVPHAWVEAGLTKTCSSCMTEELMEDKSKNK